MRKWIPTLTLLLALGGLLVPQGAAVAQGGLTLEARAGFEGYYKVNGWVPVHVLVANEGQDIDARIEVVSQDIPGLGEVIYTQPAILPTRSRKQFTLYVFVENYTRELTVRLLERPGEGAGKGRALVEKTLNIQPLSAEDFVCGVVSDDPSALNYLAGLPPQGTGRVYVTHLGLSELPLQGRVLGSIDALILHNTDTLSMSDAQRDAIRGWVSFGGHLVVTGGPSALPIAAGLEDLLPVRVMGTRTTADIGMLGDYADAPFLVNMPAVVAEVEPTTGWMTAGEVDLVLMVRRNVGGGHIDYLAWDPDMEPMRTWIGNEALWSRLLSVTASPRASATQPSWTNIRGALSNIPGINVPSVLLVAAFLFFYIVIVGPLNFLILKLIDKRAWAWVTVPVLILLFSCAAYVAGFANRGRRAVISEVTILRVLPESGIASVDSFVGLYSPVRRSYDLHLPDNALVYRPQDAFSFGPGSDLRGQLIAEQGPPTYVRQLEVDVGAMRDFAVHTAQPWPDLDVQLTLELDSGSTYRVQGTLTNQGAGDLQDCALVWNDEAVPIPDLPAGATEAISVQFSLSAPSSVYQMVENLLGSSAITARERRERERRREILQSLFMVPVYPTGGAAVGQESLSDVTLIGWSDEGPIQVEVQDMPTTVYATTLLIAPLPLTPGDSDMLLISKRSMSWRYTGGGSAMSPYALYPGSAVATFAFDLPGGQRTLAIEKLYLHADGQGMSTYGAPPVIYLKDAETGDWEIFRSLQWGRNELPDPERFISSKGTIEIQVATDTINSPLSVDFSAVGKR